MKTIQGKKVFKGGNYMRKYGMYFDRVNELWVTLLFTQYWVFFADSIVLQRGHSTTTWIQVCHFLTTPPLAWTVFITWAWTKTDIFDPLPLYLVHVVNECPLSPYVPQIISEVSNSWTHLYFILNRLITVGFINLYVWTYPILKPDVLATSSASS